MRPIDANELLEHVYRDRLDSRERIANLVNAMPTIDLAQGLWIPCSEKVPEEKGTYLTSTFDGVVDADFWNGDNFNVNKLVIAWAKMPDGYKGAK